MGKIRLFPNWTCDKCGIRNFEEPPAPICRDVKACKNRVKRMGISPLSRFFPASYSRRVH